MKVVRLSALRTGRLYLPGNSWYSFLLEAESTPGPQGSCQWIIPMIPSGIEPATFRLVAQCLNQLRNRVPPASLKFKLILFFSMTIPQKCLIPQVFLNCLLKISGSVKTNTNIVYPLMRSCTQIYKQTNKHTYIHTYIHAHTHTQIQYSLNWSSYTYTV